MKKQNKFQNMTNQKDSLNKNRGIQKDEDQKEALGHPEHPSHLDVEMTIQEDVILTSHFSIGVHLETRQEDRRQVVEEGQEEVVEMIPVQEIQAAVPTMTRTTQVSMLRYPELQEEIRSSMPKGVILVLTTPDVQISTPTGSMTRFR